MSVLRMIDKFKARKTFCTAVVVAAGSSTRMGADKLFLPMAGIPVLARTLMQFERCKSVSEIIVVAREDKIVPVADMCKTYGIRKASKILLGAETRLGSSAAGVFQADRSSSLIAISDGARPLITPELITAVVEAAKQTRAAALAVPVKDTVKIAENGVVAKTLDRNTLFAVQTPQVFEADIIKGALTKALRDNAQVTDDCSAVEAMGIPVHLIEGSYENIKITTPEDLSLAETILALRGARR